MARCSQVKPVIEAFSFNIYWLGWLLKKDKALPGDGFGMMRMVSRNWKKKIVCQTVDTPIGERIFLQWVKILTSAATAKERNFSLKLSTVKWSTKLFRKQYFLHRVIYCFI